MLPPTIISHVIPRLSTQGIQNTALCQNNGTQSEVAYKKF